MYKTMQHMVFLLIVYAFMITIHPVTASANSAEPPSLIILVNNPPDDLSIIMTSNEQHYFATVSQTAWEGYYKFYAHDMNVNTQYSFLVTTGGKSFKCSLDSTLDGYNNIFSLDLSEQLLLPGTYPLRSVILVFLRLIITLIIEGFIFWLFQFRSKRSWLVFLIINIITQGVLNICLSGEAKLFSSYLILGLIICEFFVLVAEMVLFYHLINEHEKSFILIYVFTANLVSLIAGGYLLTLLPV